ncbi:hypothetical protein DL764_008375 [Monosporascus ibericus]|uniref:WKF domain-containing protein n=1 Tax=Monosporascus ibericus TaxID=155417 RepID=A0A4Q4SXM6_9PEZI|nr:hypothetical protein DL764_008375 [Monosporascus ibericus]
MSSSTLSTSTGNAPPPRVPAWKRLGLKLKPASDESHISTGATTDAAAGPLAPAPVPQKREQINGSASAKREASGALKSDHSAKKARRDLPEEQTQTPSKKAKSVTFAAEVTESPAPAAANGTRAPASKKPKQPTKKKPAIGAGVAATPAAAAAKASKSPGKQGPVNLEPALAYLRQWHTSRDSWKFNKNHQTRLLEQVFADETTIPAVHIGVFYAYIRGLKGGVRARLRELAQGIRARDMEQGIDGFSAAAGNNGNNKKKNDKEAAAQAQRKQNKYEEVIAAFLERDHPPGERRFDEVDYVLRTTDMEMQRRVVKRMRAETVLEELADSDEEAASTATTTVTTTSSSNSSAGGTTTQTGDGSVDAEDDKRLQLNDGSQQRVKRRRLRKARTVGDVEDESSSSSSSSESESSSSSDSSSSDDDDDRQETKRLNNPKRKGAEASTSSSSSSSSSSKDSESESESESDDSEED